VYFLPGVKVKSTSSGSMKELREWVVSIELPESGQHLEYPMTAEEISAAQSQAAALADTRRARPESESH